MSPKSRASNRSRSGRHGRLDGRRTVLLVAVVAVPILVWAIASLSDDRTSDSGKSAGKLGISHVHGLGIDPEDGSLIVATHYGAFRIPEAGDAARIGDSRQDTMGFTVAGPGRFLGSGHPDLAGARRGLPGRLGLIESDDAGKTWRSLSLGGEADFHGLAFAHGQVYGWDSGTGRFMVSADHKTWDTRSRLDLFSFSVDPTDGDHVVGATPTGLVDSTDGGRSWNPTGGPGVLAVSWDAKAGLWGADNGGFVWRKAGDAWQRAGSLGGQPQDFLASPDALYAAALDGGVTSIHRSTDAGRTWDLRYRDAR